jgi:hypothetical protein
MRSQAVVAAQRILKSAIACSRVAEYPRLWTDGGNSHAVIVQNHGRSSNDAVVGVKHLVVVGWIAGESCWLEVKGFTH